MTNKILHAVDLVIDRGGEFLFIKRKAEPFKGYLALPGGLVEIDETLRDAAVRELWEETAVALWSHEISFINYFDKIDRDPRGRVISSAFYARVPPETQAKAGSDARSVHWLLWPKALEIGLAFDHKAILQNALALGAYQK